ncbi:hypothetical protein [Mesorhizobium australicum]|uniref:Uncharacterized protein n=1 Tax=Mesorhizobium australicum TaxID=536018 RepID=A0A1X7NJ04_9HYPH|nr:hypothetical protein [Mesorhizobium australicum]SMH37198.1 hypothetical protein SAMN02982922_1878 [Mesorhizobium australicum]
MFDIQFLLTAGATVIGLVNAMPPRDILRHLKDLCSKVGRPGTPAAGHADDGRAGGKGRRL